MKNINIGIIGFGTVGSGTAEVLLAQDERITRRSNTQINIKTIALKTMKEFPDKYQGINLTCNVDDILNDPEIDIVVELIGGIEPAKSYLLKAIRQGKHVVTANKALLSEHGIEIFQEAASNNVEVGFEGSVAGGIPIIKAMKEGLAANRIDEIMAILNGTANYILTKMTDDGSTFSEVLAQAQKLGYAEADPTYDVEGVDTAHKLVILINMAYGVEINLADLSIEGISQVDPIDIEAARNFGCRIKLLALSRNHGEAIEARVQPTLVPENHLLANINGAFNSVHLKGDMVGDILLYGPGAGQMATGSAVVADIIDIARNINNQAINRVSPLSYHPEHIRPKNIIPLEDLFCSYYFRFSTKDQPKVLATIAGILGDNNISIESCIQHNIKNKDFTPIVMRTYEAQEKDIQQAITKIDKLDFIIAKTIKIRILQDSN